MNFLSGLAGSLRRSNSRGGNTTSDEEKKAVKANMGVESTLYYDPVKKMWREKGKVRNS
jgi:hypothetical protein